MRDFLKYTAASFTGLILFFGLLGVGSVVLLALLIFSAAQNSEPQVRDRSILVFNLGTAIRDSQPELSPEEALTEAVTGSSTPTVTLRQAVEAIETAAKDNRIRGLLLEGGSTSGLPSFAGRRELRSALAEFKAQGKPILAYDTNWEESEYYLASLADTLMVHPFGNVELNGLASEGTFIAGALQKLGVDIQIIRVGKYKAAVESLVLTKSSPADRAQTQALLDDLWQDYLTTVATSRQVKPEQIRAIAQNQGMLVGEEAVQQKLVDQVAYYDQVSTQLRKLTGQAEDESLAQVDLGSYVAAEVVPTTASWASDRQVAVVYVEGTLVDGSATGADIVGGDALAAQLRELRLDPDVQAVVLRINSPGGSVTASEVIQREVSLIRQQKPVVVSMGDVAASGGYWISTHANRIFAEPGTITGSIGIFGFLPSVQKLGNNLGITWDTVKTSPYADMMTVTRPKTPEELAILQKSVDQLYDLFLQRVAEGRNLPSQKVAEIAQGRVWSGQTAQQLGLVDEIGGLDTAIATAAKLAKLGDDWQLQEYPASRTLEEQILEGLTRSQQAQATAPDPLTQQWQKLQAELRLLQTLNDPQGIYARLPYTLKIH